MVVDAAICVPVMLILARDTGLLVWVVAEPTPPTTGGHLNDVESGSCGTHGEQWLTPEG